MPKTFSSAFFIFYFIIGINASAQNEKFITTGGITYSNSALEKLLPRNTRIEIIGSGFQHIEGPLWVKDSNMLLFSDTKARTIYRWQEIKGISKFLQNEGYTGRMPYSEEPGTNGLALTQKNELLICEHGDRRIASYPLNGKYGLRTLTDNYEGTRYNSPNDIIVKKDGTIYFTDPPYGLPSKQTDGTKETKQNGLYCITKEGKVKLLVDSLIYPNGIAFTFDEKQLYVAVSDSIHPHILVYDIEGDGNVTNSRLFFDASFLPREDLTQRTDGLKTDTEGNVWASGPGGILIINSQGKLLGNIHTGEVIANCAWGDDGSSLYITGNTFLYRVKTKAKGTGWQ